MEMLQSMSKSKYVLVLTWLSDFRYERSKFTKMMLYAKPAST